MADVHDDPLGLNRIASEAGAAGGAGGGAVDAAWRMASPEPTTLIVPWMDDDEHPPSASDVLAALDAAAAGGARLLQPLDDETGGGGTTRWAVATGMGERTTPVVVWLERAQPLGEAEQQLLGVESCAWVVGVQTMLGADGDALPDFASLLRTVVAAFDASPAVLDVNTGRWLPRADVHRAAGDDAGLDPDPALMWLTHAIAPRGGESQHGGDTAWVRTAGLHRCGLPELEMLEAPADLLGVAVELVDGVAELLLDSGVVPPPGQAFEVGPALAVAVQPAEVVAACVREDVPGSPTDRARRVESGVMGPGPAAALCGPRPVGRYRQVWAAPTEALRRLSAGAVAVYRSERATRRQQQLAQRTWHAFATAFAAMPPDPQRVDAGDPQRPAAFLVKAPLHAAGERSDDASPNDPATGREHLWFDIRRMDGEQAEGRLLNQPQHTADVSEGAVVWLQPGQVSDWQVYTRDGLFGPANAEALAEVVHTQPVAGAE